MQSLLNSVAIFVLANTNTEFRPGGGKHTYQYFEQRIKPIHDTWGASYKYLYFVLGTNKYDWEFLHSDKNHCQLTSSLGDASNKRKKGKSVSRNLWEDANTARKNDIINHTVDGRKLIARVPQTSSRHVYETYECHIPAAESNQRYREQLWRSNITDQTPSIYLYDANPSPVKFLWVGNCTGEYFGWGPTCRAQEAMNFYNYHTQRSDRGLEKEWSSLSTDSRLFRDTQWFMFMDDDLYVRPLALDTLLRRLCPKSTSNSVDSDCGVSALVSGINMHESLRFARRIFSSKQLTSTLSACLHDAYTFSYAQPAIISRYTVCVIRCNLYVRICLVLIICFLFLGVLW
jgi:hypothetical protein